MKRFVTLLLTAALLASMMAGCGSTTKTSPSYEIAADNAAPQEIEKAEAAGEIGFTSDVTSENIMDQKLVKRVYIDAETEDMDGLLSSLNEKLSALGGYIEYQDVYNGSTHSDRRYRNASLTIRIPAEKLDGFVAQVVATSNVISVSQSQENVTLTYVATESRMKALETEQERLLELMEQAQNMSDLLEIEERLTEVRGELERVTSQLRVLSNQVDYATVELSIQQVTVYTQVEEQTIWQRVATGIRENLWDIGDEVEDLIVWLLVYSPQLVLYAVIILAVVLSIRRRRRKRKGAKTPSVRPPEENGQS